MGTVLVVDDEPDIRELVRINLELDGHSVIQAADGAEGLALAMAMHPDVVILDVMMPFKDGWQVLTEMKASDDDVIAHVPVIMLTARSDELDRIRGSIEGAIRYLTKPFSMTQLRDEVTAALTGEPEPQKRRKAQTDALEHLSRIEAGDTEPAGPRPPRPRLTRLERPPSTEPPPPASGPTSAQRLAVLSDKQRTLLQTVGTAPTVSEAAEQLSVSRSNVYASLRRIARKLEVRSVPDLVLMMRAAVAAAGP